MNRVRSEPDGLRIRLEGKLEVVEGSVRRSLEAKQAFTGPAWEADHRWHFLGDSDPDLEEALLKVREAMPEDAGDWRATLGELARVNASIRELAAKRLARLGFEVAESSTSGELVRLLRQQVPSVVVSGFTGGEVEPLGWSGVQKYFVYTALFLFVVLPFGSGAWKLFPLLLFILGLLVILLRILTGWATGLVRRTSTSFTLTPSAVRVRVGARRWAAASHEVSAVWVERNRILSFEVSGRPLFSLKLRFGAKATLAKLRAHGLRIDER